MRREQYTHFCCASTGLEACFRWPSSTFPLAVVFNCGLELDAAFEGEDDGLDEAEALPFMGVAAADIMQAAAA